MTKVNLYVWDTGEAIVTYRNVSDSPKQKKRHIVVEFWDGEFYRSHCYWNY